MLDNFEQIVEAAATVAGLLDQAPGCRVLVTSQLPLRIGHERLLRLAPLPEQAAVRLFAERARLAAPDLDLAEQHETVTAICERLDGMPLAIELAAARVAALAPSELLARLDRSLTLLARGPRDLAERHRSLRAALEWTHELLEPAERTLLARLAAFAGPAPLDAVEAVAAVPGDHGPVDAVDALSGLIDASLVRRVDDRDHGIRYTVPQAARDFAAERLDGVRRGTRGPLARTPSTSPCSARHAAASTRTPSGRACSRSMPSCVPRSRGPARTTTSCMRGLPSPSASR